MAQLSKQALIVENNTSFPNNNTNYITPSILRSFNVDMIDSLVDENGYMIDSASWNRSISSLNQFTASASGLSTGSLLVTASASSNVITFTKGDSSQFSVTVADTTNLGPLNAFTASATISLNNLNLWTSSYQPVIVNLQASQSIDNTKWNTIGSQSGSWVTESETGSFARTDISNTFTQQNIFTSISASSFVSASQFVGDGSKITNITASIALPILDEGIPQGNAVSMNFTGSAISAIVVGGTAVIAVNAISTASLNELTQSFNTYTSSTDAKFVAVGASTSSLNAFTASQQTINTNVSASQSIDTTKWNTLGGQSGSWVNVPLDSLNAFTQSQDTKNSTLATYTQSVNTSLTNINSFTASNGNTSLNSYTASNDTKWSNLSAQTASNAITLAALNSFTSSQLTINTAIGASTSSLNTATASLFTSASLGLITASVNLNTITFTKGDTSTFAITVNTGSGGGGSTDITSLNAFTASQQTKNSTLASVTSSLNSATASLFTSTSLSLTTASFDSGTRNLTFTKGNTTQFSVNIPDASGSTETIYDTVYTGESITKGDPLYISGSQGANPIVYKANAADPLKMPVSYVSNETIGASNTTSAIILGHIEGIDLTGYTAGQTIYVAEGGGWSASLPSGSSSITQLLGIVTKGGSGGKGLVLNPGPAQLPGLDTGKMWVGNGNNQPIEITTASFASSASFNSYTSSTNSRLTNIEATTASLNTSVAALNTFTQSQDTKNTTLGNLTGSFATTGSNSFRGIQSITGSFNLTGSAYGNVVSMSVTSNTASMDFNLGNYFELSASVSPIRIEVSNLKGGVTSTLALNGVTSSTINFSSNVLQPSGSAYTASVSGSNDILSFVAFNSSRVNVVSTLKMI